MNDDEARRIVARVHHGEELESTIRSALALLVQTEPTADVSNDVLKRLRAAGPCAPLSAEKPIWWSSLGISVNPWSLATASTLAFILCTIASTDAWGQVARDLSQPINEPQPIRTLAESVQDLEPTTAQRSFAERLVLISHVALMSLGLLGMAGAWIVAVYTCFSDHWRRHSPTYRIETSQRRILFYSILLYAAGILLGCVWSQATWGRPWSWDPREAFGIFTLGFGVLWLRSIMVEPQLGFDSRRRSLESASTATVAFGATLLMLVLGSRYAAKLHSYGAPLDFIPNAILVFFASSLLVLWMSFWLSLRSTQRSADMSLK